MNIKISKKATKKSIMDVTSSLEYWKENQKGEEIYKGSLIFSITEMENKKYEKAWVSKEKTKVLMKSIIDLNFEKIFGPEGFTDYGGTAGKKPRARILNVKLSPKKQYIFTITEGPGKIGLNGSIQMMGKPEKIVQTYITFNEALQMANEVYDFIRDSELKAMISGKPLYTTMPSMSENNQKEYREDENKTELDEKTFKIRKKLENISLEELKNIYDKTKGSSLKNDKILFQYVVDEVKRRKK